MHDVAHELALLIGDEDATGAAVDVRKMFAGVAYGRGVDDGQHLDQVLTNKAVKESLVVVLNGAQIDMFINRLVEAAILHIGALNLTLNTLVAWRQ